MDNADKLQEIVAMVQEVQELIPNAEGQGICNAKLEKVANEILSVIRNIRTGIR